jgi:hypothetical protein
VVVAVEVELTGDSSTDDDDGGANGRIHEWMNVWEENRRVQSVLLFVFMIYLFDTSSAL